MRNPILRTLQFSTFGAILTIALAALSTSVLAERLSYEPAKQPVQATVHVGPTYVDFDFNIEAEKGILRISGPEIYSINMRFEDTDHLTADLLNDHDLSKHVDSQMEAEILEDFTYLPTGRYKYELIVYTSDGHFHSTRGTFDVRDEIAYPRDGQPTQSQPGRDEVSDANEPNWLQRIAQSALDLIVPSAQAQIVEADNFVDIYDTTTTDFTAVNLQNDDQDGDIEWITLSHHERDFKIARGNTLDAVDDPAFTLDGSTGKIGINTDAPGETLHIVAPGGGNSSGIMVENSRSTWAIRTGGLFSDLGFRINEDSGNGTVFRIEAGAPSNSVRVASNGNVGLGTGNPVTPLHVGAGTEEPRLNASTIMAQTDGDTGLTFRNSAAGVEAFLVAQGGSLPRAIFGTLDNFPFEIRTFNQNRIFIAGQTGYIGLGGITNPEHPIEHDNGARLTDGGAWQDASSRSLKQNISPVGLDDALSAVMDLQPVSFEYKAETGNQRLGFIAEDAPDIVAAPDKKTLSSMEISAAVVQVVQEQQRILEKQQAEIQRLNSLLSESSRH